MALELPDAPLLPALDVLLRVSLLFVAAWALDRLLRRRAARLRHLVWCGAVAGALFLPLNRSALLRLDVLPGPGPVAASAPALEPPPEPIDAWRTLPLVSGSRAPSPPGLDRLPALPSEAPRPPSENASAPLLELLLALWAVGLLLGLAWLVSGLRRARALVRRARPASDPALLGELEHTASRIGLRRRIRLVQSGEIATPMTLGTLRPVVLLPARAVRWSSARLEVVILHELSHVRRNDWLWQTLAQLARSLWWFHPLAWLAYRRLADEREHACDEAVLAHGTRPSDYASHLLAIASEVPGVRRLPSTVLALTHSRLEGRLMSILQDAQPRRGSALFGPLLALLGATVVSLSCLRTFVDPEGPGPEATEPELVEPEATEVRTLEASVQEDREPREWRRVEDLGPLFERLESLEARMRPIRERLESLQGEMEPLHERMERVHRQMEPVRERMGEAREELEPYRAELQRYHEKLEPVHEGLALLHQRLEPYQRRLQEVHERMQPVHEELSRVFERLAPLQERLAELQEREARLQRRPEREADEAELERAERSLDSLGARLRALEARLRDRSRGEAGGDAEDAEALRELRREYTDRVERLRERRDEARVRSRDQDESLERELRPLRRQREEVEEEYRPLQRRLEELQRRLAPQHEELEEIQRAMRPHQERLEEVQRQLEPVYRRLEELSRRLEPREELEPLEERLEPHRQELEELQEKLEVYRERMEPLREELEPLHEEAEPLNEALEGALRRELERDLGAAWRGATGDADPDAVRALAGTVGFGLRVDGGRGEVRVHARRPGSRWGEALERCAAGRKSKEEGERLRDALSRAREAWAARGYRAR